MLETKKRYLILGASKGLGYQTYKTLWRQRPQAEFLLVSRKIAETVIEDRTEVLQQDFSKLPVAENFLNTLHSFQPTHFIYCAGGGPYGFFQDQKLSAHEWALNVNFIYPMALLHALAQKPNGFAQLQAAVFVGSSIAESQPDSKASSYCAAKHALKGWVTTLQKGNSLPFQVKLFSPGYMDTELLPPHSEPRKSGNVASVVNIAEELVSFIDSVKLNWP